MVSCSSGIVAIVCELENDKDHTHIPFAVELLVVCCQDKHCGATKTNQYIDEKMT